MRRLFPHPRLSLQRRLALALAGCVTACWLAGTVAAGFVLREEISEVFDSALQEVAQGSFRSPMRKSFSAARTAPRTARQTASPLSGHTGSISPTSSATTRGVCC